MNLSIRYMRSLLFAAPVVLVASAAAAADIGSGGGVTVTTDNEPSLFLGMAWTFGGANGAGTPGITLKALSTNKRNSAAFAGGVTYNFDGSFGCDVGVGYNTSGATITSGYDICKRGFQMGLGGTKRPDTTTTSSPVPPVLTLE